MHRLLYSFVILLAICAPASGYGQSNASYFQYPNEATPAGKAYAIFRNEVEKRSANRIHFAGIPSAPASKILQALRTGSADFGLLSTLAVGQFDAAYKVFGVPFLFTDIGAVARFLDGQGGVILKKGLREKGLVPLAVFDDGMSIGFSKKPIRSLNDLKGMKYATLSTDIGTASALASVTASSTTALPSDLSPMIINGSVDGYFGPAAVFGTKLPETRISIIPTRHAYVGFVLLASALHIDKLPTDLRQIIDDAGITAEIQGRKLAAERLAAMESEWQKSGAVFAALPAIEYEKWRSVAKTQWDTFDKSVGKDLIRYASSTGGGGDPCAKLSECRCKDRTCSTACCSTK